jgi:hypothetical protein
MYNNYLSSDAERVVPTLKTMGIVVAAAFAANARSNRSL